MDTIMDKQKPAYPARTVMKIITESQDDSSSQKALRGRIEEVFHGLLLAPRDWRSKESRQKRYISYTTTVYIQNSEQLATLYQQLQEIPQVRQIL